MIIFVSGYKTCKVSHSTVKTKALIALKVGYLRTLNCPNFN